MGGVGGWGGEMAGERRGNEREGGGGSKPVWFIIDSVHVSGTLDDQWYPAEVSVKFSSPYQIVFRGVRGLDYQGDIAIDDVSLVNGRCSSSLSKCLACTLSAKSV